MAEILLASLGRYIPETIVILTMMFLLYLESAYEKKTTKKTFMYVLSAVGLTLAIFSLVQNLGDQATGIFVNAVVFDSFGSFLKILLCLSTIGSIYLSMTSKDIYPEMKGEFMILSIGMLVGGMLLCSANNLLTLYLGIETLSILSYTMASFKKNDGVSSEAGLKYVLYGGIASGVMLFGMSHFYGLMGTIQFEGLGQAMLALTDWQEGVAITSLILFFTGIGYKIACVPFHMWSPDVYEGSPIPVTNFFALVPKLAGIGALVRITQVMFREPSFLSTSWIGLLTLVSALTMTVGNVSAIGQKKSVKRMLAFSSIGHAGMLIMGVTTVNAAGYQSILFYGLVYLFMTLTAFYIVSALNDKYGNDHFDRFNGLIYRHPFMAVFLSIAMFSLAGVPPFGGFIAKFNIISSVIQSGNYTLAIIAGLNSVISVFFYLRLVRLMVLRPAEDTEKIEGFGFVNQLIIVGISLPIILLGIFWGGIMKMISETTVFISTL